MTENKELLLRILTVREELARQVLDFLPEMVRTGISEANVGHRRKLLERLTQSQPSSSTPHPETTNTQSENTQSENTESELDTDDSSNQTNFDT